METQARAISRACSLDKGGGYDDAGAKVSGEEIDVEGHAHPANTSGEHGEEGGGRGDDENDKEGGNTDAWIGHGQNGGILLLRFLFF